jgi:hypothetical protein
VKTYVFIDIFHVGIAARRGGQLSVDVDNGSGGG